MMTTSPTGPTADYQPLGIQTQPPIKQGDRVVFIGKPNAGMNGVAIPAWEARKDTPSLVLSVDEGRVTCLDPHSLAVDWWNAEVESVRLVERATYEAVPG